MHHDTNTFTDHASCLVTHRGPVLAGIALLGTRFARARSRRVPNGIEAVASTPFRDQPTLPARTEMRPVRLPHRSGSRPGTLRQWMTGMVRDLAELMQRTERGAPPHPIQPR